MCRKADELGEKEMAGEKISITDIKGIRIGNAQSEEGMTGVTVILLDADNRAGIDISGGGPASREPSLLFPTTADHAIHAIVLSGGSAFGLDASGGVMQYLEEHEIGYHLVKFTIPLVAQAGIFDLGIGETGIRPDVAMGYQACVDAEQNHPGSGNVGAGKGASVGKLYGIRRGTKSGIGYAAYQYGDLRIGAIAVVNAYGDVKDPETGEIIGGLMDEQRTGYINMVEEMRRVYLKQSLGGAKPAEEDAPFVVSEHGNTTLGVILTNAAFSKADCSRLAKIAGAALPRCIAPVGTPADGDTVYAVSLQPGIPADLTMVGTFAADVLAEAIVDAVKSARMPDEEFLEKINI